MTYVYKPPNPIVYAIDLPKRGFVKVGITSDWDRRLAALKAEFRIVEIIRHWNRKDNRLVERMVVDELAQFAVCGTECFRVTPRRLVTAVNKACRMLDALEHLEKHGWTRPLAQRILGRRWPDYPGGRPRKLRT